MFERFKSWIRKVGVRVGLIQELQRIQDHKKLTVDNDAYERIEKNKAIYKGYYKPWHDLEYTTSQGLPQKRRMQSLGIGKVLPQKMASLIFNEKVKIDVSTEGIDSHAEDVQDPARDFILETLEENGFYNNFQRYLEYGYALSGMALKLYHHDGKIKIAYANADAFYPLSSDSENIDEALFVSNETKGGVFYTLLEWHEWDGDVYVITNELYESSQKGKLGHKVPLNTLYEDIQPVTRIVGLRRPLFVYFKLNTANNKDLTSPLGVSIFENSYDTIHMLDYVFDFWLNEFKLGKRRIAVDGSMIRPFIDENGVARSVFDSDETVFNALNMENGGVQDLTVGLRTTDIVGSINALLDLLAMQVGFSSGTFTFDGRSVMTATQVVSLNSQTYQTKNAHEVLVESGIKQLIESIVDVAQLYGLYNGSTEIKVAVDFDDSIAQDRGETYNYYSMAVTDALMPRREAIMRIFKVTEQKAIEWIAEIDRENAEEQIVSAEAADLFGVAPQNME